MKANRNADGSAENRDTWVRPYFRMYKKQMALALALGVASLACACLLMYSAGYLISFSAEMPASFVAAFVPIGFVQIFGLGKPIARYFERLNSHDWVFRMTSSLRRRLYAALERTALALGPSKQTGEYLDMVGQDIGHVQNLYLRCIFPTVIAWTLCAIACICLGFFQLWFAGVMLLVLFCTAVVAPLVSVLLNRAHIMRLQSETQKLYTDLTDNVLGARDWALSGNEQAYLSGYAKREQVRQDAARRVTRTQRWIRFAVTAVLGAAALGVTAWAAGVFGGARGGAADLIAAMTLAFFPLIDAVADLPAAADAGASQLTAARHLNSIPAPAASQGSGKQVPKGVGASQKADSAESEAPAQPTCAAIDVSDLCFSFDAPVLRGIDLHIQPGWKVAILGRSGSGKSTLLSLMHGDAQPERGSITLGGIEAARLGAAMPRFASFVQQSPYLFNRTLRENLTLAAPDATDAQLEDVLARVGLSALLADLPDGLGTMVDEGGKRFSGGEAHRIALARILLANTPIVLLDEPTTGLDPKTERALMETLFDTLSQKTLVMVTHHLQEIERFDWVVFLENGRIEMEGAPADLRENSPRFRKLLAFDRGWL